MFSVCFWHFLSFESQNDVCIRSRRHSGRHGHASPPTGSAMSDGTLSERERLVYSAKLAEQAERYDGTSDGVVSFAANSPASRRDDRVPGVERGLGLAGRLDRVSPPRTWNSVPRRTCEVDESHNLGDRTRNGRVGAVPEGDGCILIFVIFPRGFMSRVSRMRMLRQTRRPLNLTDLPPLLFLAEMVESMKALCKLDAVELSVRLT